MISWQGSSKDVRFEPDRGIIFNFSDRVSVFDLGPAPRLFPGLGELRCTIAARIFQVMENAGFRTHFRERLSDTEMLVEPFDIPERQIWLTGAAGRALPIEVLFRYEAKRKVMERVEAKQLDRATLEDLVIGERGLEIGARFKHPFVECSTKLRRHDVYILDDEAMQTASLDRDQLVCLKGNARLSADLLLSLFDAAGFRLIDGKFEIALIMTPDGPVFVIIDSISPDEVGLIEKKTGKAKDKNILRDWYIATFPKWYAELQSAQDEHPDDASKWPVYPDELPPNEVVDAVIHGYRNVADGLARVRNI